MSDQLDGGLFGQITGWIKRPFTGDMDALHWFLFLGLVLCSAFLWSRIMFYVKKGVEV
jgi:hypothetical protein